MPLTSMLVAGAVLLAVIGPAAAGPLDAYRWTSRVVVASAPDPDDPALAEQRRLFAAMGAGARDRDLVLVEAVGLSEHARALRADLGCDPKRFTAVLVGKDGGAKLRADHPLGPERLYPVIDAMPMRRGEMRAKGS